MHILFNMSRPMALGRHGENVGKEINFFFFYFSAGIGAADPFTGVN